MVSTVSFRVQMESSVCLLRYVARHDNFIAPSQLKPKSFLLKNNNDDDIDDTLNVCDSTSVETNHAVKKAKHTHHDCNSLYKKVKELEGKDEENCMKVRNMLNRYVNKINKLTKALQKNEQLLKNQNKEIKSLKTITTTKQNIALFSNSNCN